MEMTSTSALRFLPNDYLRERCAPWVDPLRDDEQPSETLQRAYRQARVDGERAYAGALWDAWFRASCAEGNNPSALRRDAGTLTERFWARTVPGPDGHVFWDAARDWQGRPVFNAMRVSGKLANRFAYELRHGKQSSRIEVFATCGERNCLNIDHLAAAWRPRGGQKPVVTDDVLIARLKQCGNELGCVPTIELFNNWRKPGMHTASAYEHRFGSFTAALRAAGYDRTQRDMRAFTNEQMLVGLRELARELGRPPTTGDWTKSGRAPRRRIIGKRFGTWANALERAGVVT